MVLRGALVRVVLVAALLGASAAPGAGSASIVVRCLDGGGKPVPGVRVEATAPSLPGRVTGVTGATGVAVLGLLPPGSWTVRLLRPDGSESRYSASLSQGTEVRLEDVATLRVEERVEVVETSAAVPSGAITAATVTLDEVDRVPVGRDYRAYVQLVPGVTVSPNSGGLETRYEPASKAGNNYHDRGALIGSRDNTWLLDGFDITGMGSGTGDYTFSNEVILEEGVVTSGVPPELPGGAGLVANVVTKSGGASFSGSLSLFLREPWMVEGVDSDDPRLAIVEDDRYDAGLTLGGPILRESLWFFVSGQERSASEDVELSPSATPTPMTTEYGLKRRNAFLKLAGRPSERDSLVVSVFGETLDTRNSRDVNVPPNRYGRSDNESLLASLGYVRMLGATGTLEARLGGFREVRSDVPQYPEEGPTNTLLFEPGVVVPAYLRDLGSSGGGGRQTNRKLQADLSGSLLVDGQGSHQLRAGVGFARWQEENAPQPLFPGTLNSLAPHLIGITFDEAMNLSFLPASEFDAILRALEENPGSAAFAAADKNGDGVVTAAELGALRFSSTAGNGGGVNFLGNELVLAGVNNVASERISLYLQDEWRKGRFTATAGVRVEQVTYVASDGSTILSIDPAFYPRLGLTFDPAGDGRQRLSLAYGEYSDPLLTPMIRFAGNLSGSIYGDQVFIGSDWFTYRTRGSSVVRRDAGFAPNLENEKETELQLAYSADLGRSLSFLGQAWYRRGSNLIEDYDPAVYFNPAVAGDLVLTPGQFGYGPGGPTDVNYFLGNLVGGKRETWGLDLSVQRRFRGSWGGAVQYSYRRAKGNSNTNSAADLQGDFLDLDPRQPYMYGTLPGTIRHQVKVFGSWQTPIGPEVGWLYHWSSGASFTESTIFRPASHAIYYNYRPAGGSYARTGDERHPSYDQLDLRLRQVVRLGKGLSLDLFLDVLNVLDDQETIRVEEAHNHPEFTTYLESRLLLEPRRYQFGARLSF